MLRSAALHILGHHQQEGLDGVEEVDHVARTCSSGRGGRAPACTHERQSTACVASWQTGDRGTGACTRLAA